MMTGSRADRGIYVDELRHGGLYMRVRQQASARNTGGVFLVPPSAPPLAMGWWCPHLHDLCGGGVQLATVVPFLCLTLAGASGRPSVRLRAPRRSESYPARR